MKISVLCIFLLLIFCFPAFAWQLSDESVKDYDALIATNKNALEAWLSAVPDDTEGISFKQLARGSALFAERAPLMQQDDFSDYLSTFPSLFSQSEIAKMPAGDKYTNDDLTASSGKGKVTFWLKTNFDSC